MSVPGALRVLGLLCVAVGVASGSPSLGLEQPPPSQQKQRRQPSPISFKNGRLSLRVERQPIEWVLEEISRKARVGMVWGERVEGHKLTIELQELPLEEALRQILKEFDAFFFYGVEKGEPSSLKGVWVYPGGKGRGLQPVPPEEYASTREVEGMLADPDPEIRSRAIEALIERKGERALDEALRLLRDGDDQVRTRTLYAALGSGLEIPTESLTQALADSSAEVRFLALEAFATRPEARSVAESALNDPSRYVRRRAEEILTSLKAAGPGPKPRERR